MLSGFQGNALVPLALLGWFPAIVLLFSIIPPRKAVLVGFIGAWLFLPSTGVEIQGLPDYGKATAASFGVLFGALIFDVPALLRFRPRWYDLPAICLCIAPFISSMTNGLGPYDGLSASFAEFTVWFIPYLMGRVYFNSLEGLREIAVAIFVGGLIYVPFCLWEIRMSPQLNRQVYGFGTVAFYDSVRFGGYRPNVFIGNGLILGLWMTVTAFCGVWLAWSKSLRVYASVPATYLAAGLFVTTVLCRSTGGLAILLLGLGCLIAMRAVRHPWPFLLAASLPVLFIVLRGGGLWDGQDLVRIAGDIFGPDRAASLNTRVVNDTMLAEKAREQLLFGWGGWGRNRIKSESGEDMSITDSLWVIKFGVNGVFGVGAMLAMILLPIYLLWFRLPPRYWLHPAAAGAVCCAGILTMWMSDCLFNAFVNPIYIVGAGALMGMAKVRVGKPVRRRAPVRDAEQPEPVRAYAQPRI